MSRYSLKPLPHRADLFEVAVGWDPGLETYFVMVFGTPGTQREPEVRLWRGNYLHDVAEAQELLAIAAQYAEVPTDLAIRLQEDQNAAPPQHRQPISRLISDLLGRASER